MSEPLEPQPTTPMPPQQPAMLKPQPNKNADAIGIIGFGTMVCEVVNDPGKKGDCRELLEPLEQGKRDPIEVLVDLLMQHPDEMDDATDRFNYNMQEAIKIAEERVKVQNAA